MPFYCNLNNTYYYRPVFSIDVLWYQPTTIAHFISRRVRLHHR